MPSLLVQRRASAGGAPAPRRPAARTISRKLPAEPAAEGASHDQLLVPRRQPRQLFGEHGDALFPRARHPRDVGPPEHAIGAEGVVELPDVAVDVAVGIGLRRIARRSGRSSGKLARIARRLGCWRAASTASALELGSHPGGWITAALTPPSSISLSTSSAV